MDISILTAATPSAPRSATPSGSGDGNGFAQHLQQAVERPSRAAPSPGGSAADAAEGNPPATAPAAAALPAEQRLPQATQASVPEQLQPLPPVIDAEAPLPTLPPQAFAMLPEASAGDSTPPPEAPLHALDEIRRRLALIEQAGQVPEASAAAGLTAPIAPPPQPAGQAPVAADAQGEFRALPASTDRPGDGLQAQPAAQPARTGAEAAPAPSALADGSTAVSDPAAVASDSRLPAPGEGAARTEPGPATLVGPNASAPSPAAAPAPTPATASLSAPLASREWRVDLGQQLIGLHQRGEQQIDLHLHPAELGPLSVSLKLGELGAQAQFFSAHPQVRAAVEQALPQLREALASQGIALGETSVGEQRQPASEQQQQGGGGRRGPSVESSAERLSEPGPTAPQRALLGQVDLYA